jgi:hypothetical protein
MTLSLKVIEDAVLASLEDLTGRKRDLIKREDRLRADLRLDGDDFSFVFVPAIERQVGVTTSPIAWRGAVTVQDAIDIFARAAAQPSETE